MIVSGHTDQCAFETRCEVVAATHDKQALLLVQLVGKRLDAVVQRKHLLDLVCNETNECFYGMKAKYAHTGQ